MIKENIKKKSYEELKTELEQEKHELEKAEQITKMIKDNRLIKEKIKQNKREEFLNSPLGKGFLKLKEKFDNKGKNQSKNGNKYMKDFKL